jgi:pimeloyl-ACP methyl ester carboxylesterase
MASIKTNGITMEYESTGDGEPLLLIMGLGGQLTDWPENVPELLASRGFRVIAVDNRDQGLSTEMDWTPPSQAKSVLGTVVGRPPKAGYLLSDMAADTAGLLDALGLDSAHVVGASMGGMIAQTLAIEHPSRVRSLTSIMSNTGDRKSGRTAARLLAAMARLQSDPATAVDRSADLRSSRAPTSTKMSTADAAQRRPLIPTGGHRPPRDHGQPRPHRWSALAAGAHPGRPRPARPVGAPQRWHRHRQGRAGLPSADVPRHGP